MSVDCVSVRLIRDLLLKRICPLTGKMYYIPSTNDMDNSKGDPFGSYFLFSPEKSLKILARFGIFTKSFRVTNYVVQLLSFHFQVTNLKLKSKKKLL